MKSESSVPAAYRKMMWLNLAGSLLMILGAIAGLFAWVYLYGAIGIESIELFFFVPVLGIFIPVLLCAGMLSRKFNCPSCEQSLRDEDGLILFLKKCPHCKISYKSV